MIDTTAFYGALVRQPFPATSGRRCASLLKAHERAATSFKEIRGVTASFKAIELSGS